MNAKIPGSKEKEVINVTVRFLKPVPKFMGKDLETFGPFEKDDVASLPKKIANILVNKDRVELIDAEK